MCRLRWRDVDVHHERLVVDEAKTDAGNRHVDLSLDVMEELMAWRAERQPASRDEYVFATASGRPRDKENISVAFSDRPESVWTSSGQSGTSRRCRRSRRTLSGGRTSVS